MDLNWLVALCPAWIILLIFHPLYVLISGGVKHAWKHRMRVGTGLLVIFGALIGLMRWFVNRKKQ